MQLPVRLALLFALSAALSASVGTGQPPTRPAKANPKSGAVRPTYSAFPDLKPAGGKQVDAALPPVPQVGSDAPPLRRVQYEQVQEGLAYLAQTEEVIRLGAWDIDMLRDYAAIAGAVYAIAAELEEKPEKRVPWFEARVRKMKESEGYVERAVLAGGAASQALNVARFQRLQAEADLLRLKADVEKEKGK